MSLRFIPDQTKNSPLKMFLRYAENKEKQEMKAKRKKLLSFEYFLIMRGMLNEMFGFQGIFLNSLLNEYNIEERKPKAIVKGILSAFEERYFIDGKFNVVRFDKDYSNSFNKLSKSFNTNDVNVIAQKIVNRNEYNDSNRFDNEKTSYDVAEFKESLSNRQQEMAFLMMYLAKAKKTDYNTFMKTNESSQIVNDITSRDMFLKIRSEYQIDLENKLKKNNKVKMKKL